MRKFFALVFVLVAVAIMTACSPVTAEQYNAQATQVSELKNQQATQVALLEKMAATPTLEQTVAPAVTTEEVVVQAATPESTATFVPTATATPMQYAIPLGWFAEQGMAFSDGVTVAYTCEQGARAWQGEINFNVVPTDANIEIVEVNCIQYKPGEEIPQDELIAMRGFGTIWFQIPIETTLNQMGDCPCPNGDC
jgi:hypothetical protein